MAAGVQLSQAWPDLPLDAWRDTYATLHMWTQIAGKTRLALRPYQNHWWQVTLHLSARGLTTGPMAYASGLLDIEFDFVQHRLVMRTSQGAEQTIALRPMSVAAFYRQYLDALEKLGVSVKIWPVPVETDHVTRFAEDEGHASYDAEYANRFWRILVVVDDVFTSFRGCFIGKSSPSHFFWGSFDHVVTRFSGRLAPVRPEANAVDREAYSHEVISAGFWPGSGAVQEAAFYVYSVPEPAGLREAHVEPSPAYYHKDMGMFILPYAAVRESASPADTLMSFLQSTYEAAATLAGWDRASLEHAGPIEATKSRLRST